MKKYTPMFEQYLQIKADYTDCILFYRLGDFYEMFFEDAVSASGALDLKLTGRDCGMPERAPMCGIPYHSYEGYLCKLIALGFKVAICEQTTPPSEKGLVKREVIRVVTSGTVTESNLLSAENNFLCAVYQYDGGTHNNLVGVQYGVAFADITTTELGYEYCKDRTSLVDSLAKIKPKEIICNHAFAEQANQWDFVKNGDLPKLDASFDIAFDLEKCHQATNQQLGEDKHKALSQITPNLVAVGALLQYVTHTQKSTGVSLNDAVNQNATKTMQLGKTARRTLELDKNTRDGGLVGTLYSVINFCKTDMGKRLLIKYLNAPSTDVNIISHRHTLVQTLCTSPMHTDSLVEAMAPIKDLERLSTRIASRIIKPFELNILCK
ncbi:MAG: DNA mismatch repair protein MutS, partial [Firmicutes bacterium]|nr:DNA mismatch repair protein MutS [Bacillota bacterium]